MKRGLTPVLGLLLSAAAGCQTGHPQSMLEPAGPAAAAVARLWWVMLIVLGISFVIVIALTLRAVSVRGTAPPGGHSRFVIVGGILFPAVVLTGFLFYSLDLMLDQRRPDHGTVIQVIGHQWWWEIRYPEAGVITANEIYLPAGEPVQLQLWAADVVHSFWVPNLHGKIDLIPEVVNQFWLHASEPGRWRGQCAEFCGVQHAIMALPAVALPPTEFGSWLAERQQVRPPPENHRTQRGAELFFATGCATCHAVRGTAAEAAIGPDLTHVASRATLAAGAISNTPEHLARWILEPQAIKPGNRMPATPLNPEDLAALVAYLQTLR